MSDFEVLRILALVGWALWVLATVFITRFYVSAWVQGLRFGRGMPFVAGIVVLGVSNVIETSITAAAVLWPGFLGIAALYLLLIWPIVRALSFILITGSVVRARRRVVASGE